MKVTIVRGPGLSKWEMQIYEPLVSSVAIKGIGSTRPVNDVNGITFPIEQCVCPAQFFQSLPGLIPFSFHIWGDTQWLLNFDQAVAGADIVHVVELRNGYSYQAIQAKKKGLIKAVTVSVYENIPFITDDIPARKRIKDEVIKFADHFFAINEIAKHALLGEGVENDRISIIPQAVNTQVFKPGLKMRGMMRQRLGLSPNDVFVLGCGRLVWEKGVYDFVRGAAYINQKNILLKKGGNVRFVWIGEGAERKKITKLVSQRGLEHMVKFIGSVPYQQMPHLFQAADLFVLPSIGIPAWNEQFGGVLIEALSSSLPIIGTDNGGIAETIHGTGNIVIPPQNFYALAQAVIQLVQNPAKMHRIGSQNRKKAVQKYDIKKVAHTIKLRWDMVLGDAHH